MSVQVQPNRRNVGVGAMTAQGFGYGARVEPGFRWLSVGALEAAGALPHITRTLLPRSVAVSAFSATGQHIANATAPAYTRSALVGALVATGARIPVISAPTREMLVSALAATSETATNQEQDARVAAQVAGIEAAGLLPDMPGVAEQLDCWVRAKDAVGARIFGLAKVGYNEVTASGLDAEGSLIPPQRPPRRAIQVAGLPAAGVASGRLLGEQYVVESQIATEVQYASCITQEQRRESTITHRHDRETTLWEFGQTERIWGEPPPVPVEPPAPLPGPRDPIEMPEF